MKKFILLCVVAISALLISSCSISKPQYPKYTSSDRLYQLRIGDSFETVVSVLGCEPYNLLSKQADGYDIYVYKYKIVERRFDAKVINERGSESSGTEIYKGKELNVFLVFKNNKLESVITDEGRKDGSQVVMLHNTLYELTKNAKGEYMIVPTSLQAPESSSAPTLFPKKK